MKRLLRAFKLRQSLLSQYLLIVLAALLLLPLSSPLVSLLLYWPLRASVDPAEALYRDGEKLEKMWRSEAAKLEGAADGQVDETLRKLKIEYPRADMFWVDESGKTRLTLTASKDIPAIWNASYTVRFMKERTGGDPFTVIGFIGEGERRGFMVFELARSTMNSGRGWSGANMELRWIFAGFLLILLLFLLVSLLFFYRIRRRLVRLQKAMTVPSDTGIPGPVNALNEDEIGRLERSFNRMVQKLEDSREREIEEEALRRDLIAKLSHDLRTPLTTIRGHAFSLKQEALTDKGKSSIELIERKTDYLGQLIENLISYSLLTSGKYPYRQQRVDIVRLARTHFAGWYPVFEQNGFEIDSELSENAFYWEADPQWLERVLDNILQNVLRHAKSGRFVALHVSACNGGSIAIRDRGPGMTGDSEEKGMGIGLSIATLMLKEMNLSAHVTTGVSGTIFIVASNAAPSDSFLTEA
ncbi:histidine kinase dimerization/phospho-acceptor domain-containing protein [Cohnella faecalis]|uniref:histidine kinase n=1 Tax=Cohnella faecalis TaxID=2315694 RepID=A0A398CRM0_9BACL|nr:HAMP domain-containing sensor histidine kinase [Cohnella faecalis]RIE05192.1 sensor histidine kinase [Cohnella faecalis]